MKEDSRPLSDESLLIKYKTSGMPDDVIAARMGISVAQLNKRWESIIARSKDMVANGYAELCEAFTVLAHQYQLVGVSLENVSTALSNIMPPEEIKQLIDKDPDKTLRNLSAFCIVLRPYVPADPLDALQVQLKKTQNNN